MILKQIIKTEEKLLKIEDGYKTVIDFNDCVALKKYLNEIGFITNIYFELMEDKQHMTMDDAVEYNEKLLQSKVETDNLDLKKINDFISTLLEKYNIEL